MHILFNSLLVQAGIDSRHTLLVVTRISVRKSGERRLSCGGTTGPDFALRIHMDA